jgi:FKBP-type peptidyl-prolyl cis-trans isomerase
MIGNPSMKPNASRALLTSLALLPALVPAFWPAPVAAQAPTQTAQAEPVSGPGSQSWHAEQQNYLSRLKAEDGWHWAEGGLRWRWVATETSTYGAGAKPLVSDLVTVHYEGTFLDGTVFDSSYTRGTPAKFPLGRLIKGWQLAIPQMSVGDTIEVAIPADLAYGPVGRPTIPGGATLLFKVELLGIGDTAAE